MAYTWTILNTKIRYLCLVLNVYISNSFSLNVWINSELRSYLRKTIERTVRIEKAISSFKWLVVLAQMLYDSFVLSCMTHV